MKKATSAFKQNLIYQWLESNNPEPSDLKAAIKVEKIKNEWKFILETIFLSRQVLFELKTNELKIQARNFTIVYMSET